MRYLFILVVFCVLSASAQSKEDTKIFVKADDTTKLFNRIVKILYESGYSVAQKDAENGFIMTDEKAMGKAYSIKLKVLVKGDVATITGMCALDIRINGLNRTFDQVKYKKSKSHIYNGTWMQMEQLARDISGRTTYGRD